MLKVFRDNLKYLSWVLWLVIAVFILFVFVDFGATVPGAPAGSDAAATVGGERVSYGEFQRAYRRAEDVYREAYGESFSSDIARQIGLHRQVLDGLVADKILLAESRRIGLSVADEEVRREILALPAFRDENDRFVGEERYQSILRRNGYTADGFEQLMREQLLLDKVRSVLAQNLWVSDAEVERAYRDRVERASIRFVKLPADRFAGQATLDEAGLAGFFERHREEYRVPERRAVWYLEVDQAVLQSTIEIGDDEVERFYNENSEQFTRDEQVRARHILLQVNEERTAEAAERELAAVRQRIEGGADFAAVAAEVSEDPGSKAAGGDLGFFGRGQMVPAFEEAAFTAEIGALVGPVKTSFGAHLIEVLERRPGGLEPLADARERIRGQLRIERARTVAESKAQELAARMRKEKLDTEEKLRALAEAEAGVSFRAVEPFAEDENVAGIGRSTAFAVAAFRLEKGETGDPVRVARGWAIPRVTAIEEPRLPELEEVRAEVEAAYLADKHKELAVARLAEAKAGIAGAAAPSGGGGLDAVAADLGLEVEESAEFGRGEAVGSLGRDARLVSAALALDVGAIGGPLPYDGGAVLFEVVERHRFDPVEFDAQKAEIRAAIEQRRFAEVLTALISKRREELRVRYDEQMLQNFEGGPAAPA